jgi:hypothetical protein
MMVRGIAILLLLVAFPVCFAQNSFSSYVAPPAARFTYATSSSPASTGVVVIGQWAIVGTSNGQIQFRNISMAVNTSAVSALPDYWLQVTNSAVTSLWWNSESTFGFISNNTIAVYSVTTRTAVWSFTAPWGILDIQSPNYYIQTWDPMWMNGRIYVGSQNTSAGTNPNSTIYAFNAMTGLLWATSVTNSYSNYLMSGDATDDIVVVRTSPYSGTSSILALNGTTGALLPFQGTSDYGASASTPLFVYYKWRVFAIVGNGYFQSFSIADSSSTTQYSLSCSSGSSMLPPQIFNNSVYFPCSSTVYAYTADNMTTLLGSSSAGYTITMWTITPDMSKAVIGTYDGDLYWYFPMNYSVSYNAFYSSPSYSTPVVGFTWVDWTLLVSFGYGSYYGRVQALDVVNYRIVWSFDDSVMPIGQAWPVQTEWGWFVFTSSSYDVGTGSTYLYRSIQGVLLNSTGGSTWAMTTYNGNSFYSGAMTLNTTNQLMFVVDYYGYAYGINATTGMLLFRSTSNCDSSSYGTFLQVGNNMCFQYSGSVKCIDWMSAVGTFGTTSCSTVSSSQTTQYETPYMMTSNGYLIAAAYYSVVQVNPSTTTQLNNYQNKYKTLAGTTTTDSSYAYGPAVSGTKIFVVQTVSIGAYDTSLTTPTTALWSQASPSSISTTNAYIVTFHTNAAVLGSNVYVVGTAPTSLTSLTIQDCVYCYMQSSGTSCGTTRIDMSNSQWILAANGAIFVFGIYNFTAVAQNGGSVYFHSNVSTTTETINVEPMNQPTVSSNGFLGLSTYSTVYTFNGWTGQLLWSYPTGGAYISGKTQQASNGLVYWSSGYRNYASHPMTGEMWASWSIGSSSSYVQGYAPGNWGWFYAIQSSIMYGTPTPMLANVTGVRAPGAFAPSNWLLEEIKKNKLWIIAVVVGILVIAVIGFLVTRNKRGDGQKDESYVSMNNQGGRV